MRRRAYLEVELRLEALGHDLDDALTDEDPEHRAVEQKEDAEKSAAAVVVLLVPVVRGDASAKGGEKNGEGDEVDEDTPLREAVHLLGDVLVQTHEPIVL